MITECKECGKKFQDLRSHLRKHKMTWVAYRDKHGDTPSKIVVSVRLPESERIAQDVHLRALERSQGYIHQF